MGLPRQQAEGGRAQAYSATRPLRQRQVPACLTDGRANTFAPVTPWADTTTPAGRMVLTVFAGVAEFERALIRHRTDEGRQAAKRRGVSFGRPQKLRPDQKTLALSLV